MGASGSSGSNIYQYPNQPAAAQGALGGAQGLQQASQGTQNLFTSAVPGLQGLTQGTNYNAQTGVNAGQNEINATAGLPQAAAGALQAGSNANSGLYSQELQQMQDQTNAALAQRGIADTPYGAGVESQADQSFNNQWNTQQVGLQNTAANTASTLLGQYNQGQSGGAQTAQNAANNPLGALQSMITSGNLSTGQLQQAIGDYLAYLGGGTSAASAQSTAANQNAQIQNQGLQGLGQLVGLGAGLLF